MFFLTPASRISRLHEVVLVRTVLGHRQRLIHHRAIGVCVEGFERSSGFGFACRKCTSEAGRVAKWVDGEGNKPPFFFLLAASSRIFSFRHTVRVEDSSRNSSLENYHHKTTRAISSFVARFATTRDVMDIPERQCI